MATALKLALGSDGAIVGALNLAIRRGVPSAGRGLLALFARAAMLDLGMARTSGAGRCQDTLPSIASCVCFRWVSLARC